MSDSQRKSYSDYRYIVASPIGPHKEFIVDKFIKSVSSFDPAPEEIVVCIDWDQFSFLERFRKNYPHVKVLINPNIGYDNGELERISYAREILRHYFIKSQYDFCLWIDSDIVCPSNFSKLLIERHKKTKSLLHCHPYLGRGDRLWNGSGIMFSTKCACNASIFYVGERNGCYVSEDYTFIAIIRQIGNYFSDTVKEADVHGIDENETCKKVLHYIDENMTENEILVKTALARLKSPFQ